MIAPDYKGGSIVNLSASILRAFGVHAPSPVCRDLSADWLRSDAGIVLLTCDALGLLQVEAGLASGRLANFRRLQERAPEGLQRLTSVFPSTTTVALTSLSTACTPAQHGVLGHRQWMSEIGATCNMLRFTTEEETPTAFTEDDVRAVPTVFQSLAAAGIASWTISSAAYMGSAFTNLICAGATYVGYESQSEIAFLLDDAVDKAEGRPAFYSVYWPMIDTLAHIYGPYTGNDSCEVCLLEMEFIDLMIGKLLEVCQRRGLALIVTADHGQTLLRPERAVLLGEDVARLLCKPPGGGRRALYLYTEEPQAVADRPVFDSDDVELLAGDEAIARGWFGGDCGAFRARVGDLIAIAHADRQLLYDYGTGVHLQTGAHAGLSEEEMLVPLLVAPAD